MGHFTKKWSFLLVVALLMEITVSKNSKQTDLCHVFECLQLVIPGNPELFIFPRFTSSVFKVRFKRRISHAPNTMQIRSNNIIYTTH